MFGSTGSWVAGQQWFNSGIHTQHTYWDSDCMMAKVAHPGLLSLCLRLSLPGELRIVLLVFWVCRPRSVRAFRRSGMRQHGTADVVCGVVSLWLMT